MPVGHPGSVGKRGRKRLPDAYGFRRSDLSGIFLHQDKKAAFSKVSGGKKYPEGQVVP